MVEVVVGREPLVSSSGCSIVLFVDQICCIVDPGSESTGIMGREGQLGASEAITAVATDHLEGVAGLRLIRGVDVHIALGLSNQGPVPSQASVGEINLDRYLLIFAGFKANFHSYVILGIIRSGLALDLDNIVISGRWHTAIWASTSVAPVSCDVDILGSVG